MLKTVGSFLLLLGTALFLAYPAYLSAPTAVAESLPFESTFAYYMLGNAGALLAVWALMILNANDTGVPRKAFLVSSALGFFLVAFVRLITLMASPAEFSDLKLALGVELVAFSAVSLIIFKGALPKMSLVQHMTTIHSSARSLPMWVRIWAFGILMGVNLASFLFMGHPIGMWAAMSAVFILVLNPAVLFLESGISKATAISHLFPWIPLQIYLVLWISGSFTTPQPSAAVITYAWVLFVANSISLAFDLMETVYWLRGDRGVAGAEAA